MKFQDSEEINAHDLADALEQMHQHGRFNEMLVIIDTCQASTMFDQIRVPNVITIASSSKGESSYSVHDIYWFNINTHVHIVSRGRSDRCGSDRQVHIRRTRFFNKGPPPGRQDPAGFS